PSAPLQAYGHAAPPPPAQQVGRAVLGVALRGSEGGPSRISVAIAPEALGRVEISIEQDGDGPAQVSVKAERAETLLLLMRDAGAIEQALAQAGMGPETGRSLSLGLSDSGGQGAQQRQDGRGGQGSNQGSGQGGGRQGQTPAELAEEAALAAAARRLQSTSLLDLAV
ncbi:flagellar hook-length control protein FliK, partial [Roseomonas sp. 18066]|uniref:flagellar hook-length control protein FliK n=1 Tax=Roseomonas sp. 18066 TaxID=2681412 RepID=UPI00190F1A04